MPNFSALGLLYFGWDFAMCELQGTLLRLSDLDLASRFITSFVTLPNFRISKPLPPGQIDPLTKCHKQPGIVSNSLFLPSKVLFFERRTLQAWNLFLSIHERPYHAVRLF
jgi:hypothetical protein